MSTLAVTEAPHIDWAGISSLIALFGGAVVVLLVGLLRARFARLTLVPVLTIVAFAASIGLAIWQWDEDTSLMSGALGLDPLAMIGVVGIGVAGIAAVLLSIGATAPREAAHGEYHAMMLVAAAGGAMFVGAENLITTFIGLELLSIPLYVLAATELHRRRSLESGLKYLIVGSVGSATLLYGFALIFGATGSLDYAAIADQVAAKGLGDDPLMLGGVAMVVVGLAFKSSVAPFHQWTPDVYEGAPTPVTAFMATATKVAALIAFLRLFDGALIGASDAWGPALAALASIAIIVGNVGALGQSSMKRLLAFSSIAQAGYMLVGVVVATKLGVQATVFYVLTYVVMTAAAFAVIEAAERESGHDGISALAGLGRRRPLHAIALTLSMLGLAGVPATVGFVAKLRIVQAAVDGDYSWLAIVLVVGSMISFVYYLRVVARLWTDEPAGVAVAPQSQAVEVEAPEAVATTTAVADPKGLPAAAVPGGGAVVVTGATILPMTVLAVVAGAAIVVLGVIPGPLMTVVEDVARAVPELFR
ncbi:NADH-quinone oxidoreductase subunit N [Patulibacter minatonensis]|uniref:NADH-quinone oxidoreductase subunit N n=1 Tax=Patulibacter minatonensis TaxID=298163 RepID=UPI0004B0CE24|nr:NADH-quinone oxidoreductase subunit N [Patulibacter minatonensis]